MSFNSYVGDVTGPHLFLHYDFTRKIMFEIDSRLQRVHCPETALVDLFNCKISDSSTSKEAKIMWSCAMMVHMDR